MASVFTTWDMSLQLLHPETPTGAANLEVLNAMAYLNETDISEEMFATFFSDVVHDDGLPTWMDGFLDGGSWSSLRFRKTMSDLKQLSLIDSFVQKDDSFWHVSLHPLIKDWIRLRQTKAEICRSIAIASRVLAALSRKYLQAANENVGLLDPNFDGHTSLPPAQEAPLSAHLSQWQRNVKRLAEFPMTPLLQQDIRRGP